MKKGRGFINYLNFIFSGWYTEEINYAGTIVHFKRLHNSILFNPKSHFEELLASMLSLDPKPVSLDKHEFKKLLSSCFSFESHKKLDLEARFLFNQLPIEVRRFTQQKDKVVNTFFVYSFSDMPILILNKRFDRGKHFDQLLEDLSYANGSTLSYKEGGGVLCCSGEQLSRSLYTPDIALLSHLVILSNLKPERLNSAIL